MVLTSRFSRSLHLSPWTYRLYALREKLLGSKKSAASKLLAPEGECIFDGFWCDFAKQDTNLASKSAPKDAKMNRHRATRFDSRTANLYKHCITNAQQPSRGSRQINECNRYFGGFPIHPQPVGAIHESPAKALRKPLLGQKSARAFVRLRL